MVLEVAVNRLTEGPDRETRKLNVLKSERNKDDSDTIQYARDEVERCGDKSAENEPDDVAEGLH